MRPSDGGQGDYGTVSWFVVATKADREKGGGRRRRGARMGAFMVVLMVVMW